MRIIIAFIIPFSVSPVYAEMYKCIAGGRVSYQDSQCLHGGSVFKKKKDISVEQQKAAVDRLTMDLDALAEKKKSAQKEVDRERQIRAEEDSAIANYQTARQTERQAEALEKRNEIDQRRLNNAYRNRVYINPYFRPKPNLRHRHKHKLKPHLSPSLKINIESD